MKKPAGRRAFSLHRRRGSLAFVVTTTVVRVGGRIVVIGRGVLHALRGGVHVVGGVLHVGGGRVHLVGGVVHGDGVVGEIVGGEIVVVRPHLVVGRVVVDAGDRVVLVPAVVVVVVGDHVLPVDVVPRVEEVQRLALPGRH